MTIAQMHFTSFDGRLLTLAFYMATHAVNGKTSVGFGVSHAPNNITGRLIESIDQSPLEVIQKCGRRWMNSSSRSLRRRPSPAPMQARAGVRYRSDRRALLFYRKFL
jgi:hypothetical protein